MFSWLFIALFGIVVLVVLGLAIRAHVVESPGRPAVLVVGRFIAIAYALIALLSTVAVVITTLVSDFVEVSLPVRKFWPKEYPWVTLDPAPAATVVGGGFTAADVTVSGLGTDARLLLAGGHALQGLVVVVIAVVVALLCHRLLSGSPFRPLLARSMTLAAATIAVGGIAWQILFQIGGLVASTQTLTVTGWNSAFPTVEVSDFISSTLDTNAAMSTGLPEAAFGMSVDFWPLFLGLALAAVAIAFRYSERLQRDTEGLV